MKKEKKVATYIATEAEEQKALFEWAELAKGRYPVLELMYHIPNEGRRSLTVGRSLREQGLKKGVPDICLPVPSHHFTALYIEMKRRDGGEVSKQQRGWIAALNRVGNLAVICNGWEEARNVILEYLRQ